MKLDKIDLQILDCLKENGRVAYSSVAKEVGLTATAVGQRVQKMIQEEVIKGFDICLDENKLGINIQAVITVKLNFTKIESFYKIIKTYKEIQFCYRVTGEDCVMMKVHFRDNPHLLSFLDAMSVYGSSKTNVIIDQLV